MLQWNDVIAFADKGNPAPDRRVEMSEDEWKAKLTEEQFYVTRQHGTERAFSSDMCSLFEPVNMHAYAAIPCFSMPMKNLNRGPDGLLLPSH